VLKVVQVGLFSLCLFSIVVSFVLLLVIIGFFPILSLTFYLFSLLEVFVFCILLILVRLVVLNVIFEILIKCLS